MQAQKWRVWELLTYILAALLGVIAVTWLRVTLLGAYPQLQSVLSITPVYLLLEYVFLLLPLGALLLYKRRKFNTTVIPIQWRGWIKTLVQPVFAWLIFLAAIFITSQLFANIPGVNGPSVQLSSFPQDTFTTVLLIVMALCVAPVAEEILFRGFMQPALLQWFRPMGAIGFNALLFAIMHQQDGVVILLFIFGCFAGWLSWKNDSILPSIVFHVVNNGVTLYMDYVVKTGS